MKASSVASAYRALAVLSVLLLWGFYVLNGGVKANLLAPLAGRLNEDIALKTDYTGIFIIDYPVSMLIAFFYFVTDASDEGIQLFVFEGCSTIQSSVIWLYAENIRPGKKPWSIARPTVFVLVSQTMGGAISLPLYYACHALWGDSAKILRVQDRNAAMALPLSFILGAILPAIAGFAPTWEGPDSRSPEVHQKYLAFFLAGPLLATLTQTIVSGVLGRLCSNDSGDRFRTAHRWTRASYLMAAASSAIGHLYTTARIITSTDERTNFVRMNVPFPPDGPTGGLPDILARGPFLFLQFDVAIYSIASVVWVFWLLSGTVKLSQMSAPKLAFGLLVGYLTIGAGATVSLALYVREGLLPEKEKAED